MCTDKIIVIANTNGKYEESNSVYSSEGIVATLTAGGYKGKLIAIKSEVSREHKS